MFSGLTRALFVAALFRCIASSEGTAWNPFEPSTYIEPSDECKDEFAQWLDPPEYAACIEQWNTAPLRPDASPEEAQALAIASGDNGTRVVAYTLHECTQSCYKMRKSSLQHDPPTRWLIAVWSEDKFSYQEGTCLCYGEAPQQTADYLDAYFGIRVADSRQIVDAAAPACVGHAVMVPVSCLWTGGVECAAAPGAPDGCLYTRTGCCVDAKGHTYSPQIVENTDPWEELRTYAVYLSALFAFPSTVVACLVYFRNRRPPPRPISRLEKPVFVHDGLLGDLKRATFKQPEPSDDPCAVCLLPYTKAAQVTELPCRHRYHFDCLKAFLDHQKEVERPKCPTCRAPMAPDPPTPEPPAPAALEPRSAEPRPEELADAAPDGVFVDVQLTPPLNPLHEPGIVETGTTE
ncbi:hypothetical protein DIPPA_17406 [Diplonema papillatum]|nr:hypothetical protein DIPPA_17406 [Diplonema papillatum]